MAITITQERKKQRYLLLILALVIFTILLVVWLGFFRKEKELNPSAAPAVIYAIPKVDIDWQMLDDLRGKTTQPFEEISTFEGDFGRKNPFISY